MSANPATGQGTGLAGNRRAIYSGAQQPLSLHLVQHSALSLCLASTWLACELLIQLDGDRRISPESQAHRSQNRLESLFHKRHDFNRLHGLCPENSLTSALPVILPFRKHNLAENAAARPCPGPHRRLLRSGAKRRSRATCRKSGRETQRSLFCSGGQGPPVVAGLCMSCYQGVTQNLNPGFWHQLEISGLIGISGAER